MLYQQVLALEACLLSNIVLQGKASLNNSESLFLCNNNNHILRMNQKLHCQELNIFLHFALLLLCLYYWNPAKIVMINSAMQCTSVSRKRLRVFTFFALPINCYLMFPMAFHWNFFHTHFCRLYLKLTFSFHTHFCRLHLEFNIQFSSRLKFSILPLWYFAYSVNIAYIALSWLASIIFDGLHNAHQ